MWSRSLKNGLVVLFLFESPSYYNFLAECGWHLETTLRDLARNHYFLILNNLEIQVSSLDKVCGEMVDKHLILVVKKDGLRRVIKDEDGMVVRPKSWDHISKFEVHTGKRKVSGMEGRVAKRQALSMRRAFVEFFVEYENDCIS
jgi:hypothetical protein